MRAKGSEPDDTVGQKLSELVRAVPAPSPLGDEALERVRRRLDVKHGARRPVLSLRAPSLAVATLSLATVAFGGFALSRILPPEHGARPLARTLSPRAAPKPAALVARVPPPTPEPLVTATSAAPPSRSAPPADAPKAKASALSEESAALEPALGALRRSHDPKTALALLDRYDARFPHGILALDAGVARVDAYLALGRRDDALLLLERLPLERVGRGTELRLVRGELRQASDCARALPDFDAVLASQPRAALEERALYARASCRLSLGDGAGARADIDTYLARYPDGRFKDSLSRRLR